MPKQADIATAEAAVNKMRNWRKITFEVFARRFCREEPELASILFRELRGVLDTPPDTLPGRKDQGGIH